MRVVPAVEISSVDRNKQDLHVLGYLIDHHDPVLRERLRTWREDRERRAEAMGAALRELGYELDESEIARAASRRASRSAGPTSPTRWYATRRTRQRLQGRGAVTSAPPSSRRT